MGSERELIPVISRLSRESRSVEEAIELIQSALKGEIGEATLLVDPMETGSSPQVAKSVAAFLDSKLFPFRGLYTAPVMLGNKSSGRLLACFGSFGTPGRSLPALTAHIARELGDVFQRTRHIPRRLEAA